MFSPFIYDSLSEALQAKYYGDRITSMGASIVPKTLSNHSGTIPYCISTTTSSEQQSYQEST